jgi:hypothetical protein
MTPEREMNKKNIYKKKDLECKAVDLMCEQNNSFIE